MTYIVADRHFIIADRLVQTIEGNNIVGRQQPNDDGSMDFHKRHPGKTTWHNDCLKLYTLPKGKYNGEAIKLIALAGDARNELDMFGALTQGVDLSDYMKVEANIQPKSERRIFSGATTVLVHTEEGTHHILSADNGDRIEHARFKNFAHMGSGVHAVNGIRFNIPKTQEKGATRLTALEAFVIAAAKTDTVSRNFDTYEIATGKLTYDRRLSERQMEFILKRVQSRIDLSGVEAELKYLNED